MKAQGSQSLVISSAAAPISSRVPAGSAWRSIPRVTMFSRTSPGARPKASQFSSAMRSTWRELRGFA